MWVKQCHKPPTWELFIPPIKMVMTGEWFMTLFYTHYRYVQERADRSTKWGTWFSDKPKLL